VSILGAANRGLHLQLNIEHPLLDQFRGRPPTREDGGAEPPEPLLLLHLELGAADRAKPLALRKCFALACTATSVCLRTALGKRSRRPRRAAAGMAVGSAGSDLKKGRWAIPNRPLIQSVHGCSGSDEAYRLSCETLDEGDFGRRHRSLLRMHNGRGGDPRLATGFLDRPPTEHEWNATLAILISEEVHASQPGAHSTRRQARVSPHLLRDANGRAPGLTSHSLKQWKISAYHALLLHTDYIVEPGAHAGSEMERLSISGANASTRAIRPTGLNVGLRYARASRGHSAIEVEHLVWTCLRAWLASAPLATLPRTEGWAALTRWSSDRAAAGGDAGPASLYPMAPSIPEAEEGGDADLDEAAAAQSDEEGAGEE
jgi:hypothetical protein